jgi:thiol-disulfide isomerase/thioredoxin
MPSLNLRLPGAVTLVLSLCLASGNARAADTDPDGRLFEPSADPVADVQQALSRAADSDRRALVVLGANWCHDSRALASRLHSSPLAEVIQQNYELVFVDVGYYENGRAVTQEFGVANYYATPTVLIIDPSSGELVNDEDRHIWGNAFRIGMSDSVQYFEKWAVNEPVDDPAEESPQLRQLYAQIDQFEQQMADRVAAGYAVVGPMLEAYKHGNAPEEFDASWDELSAFRNAIPRDILKLRDEAQRRVSEGEQDIELQFPEYRPLSWESD